MADHQITTVYTKSGAAFNTVTEAMEAHMAASSDSATTIADHDGFVDAQTNFTEVKKLTSNGEPVSSGTAGNGYSLTRTWTRAKLLAFAQTWSSLDDAKGEPTNIGSGWTVSHTDINPSTGELNPVWGGNDTGGALQSNYGTAGI